MYKNNRSFAPQTQEILVMLHYLKYYPFSLAIIAIICYLSFFTPPETEAGNIPYIDKVVHICMYGGLCFIIWLEYLIHYPTIKPRRIITGGVIAPILMSGCIELLQEYCTANRSGDWADFLANITGVILAAAFGYYILRPYFRKKRNADYSPERPTQ